MAWKWPTRAAPVATRRTIASSTKSRTTVIRRRSPLSLRIEPSRNGCANWALRSRARARSVANWNRNARDVVVARGPERVQRHRHEVVLADGEHDIEKLLYVVARFQRGVRGVGQRLVAVQLVGRAQQQGIVARPSRRVGTIGNPRDLVVGDTDGAPDRDMLCPLVRRAAVPTGAEDEELTITVGQRT